VLVVGDEQHATTAVFDTHAPPSLIAHDANLRSRIKTTAHLLLKRLHKPDDCHSARSLAMSTKT